MNITTVLFDLDGTLLPMEQERFVGGYFKLLAEKLAPHGYEPKALTDTVWAGTAAMMQNDGSCCNESAFWNRAATLMGPKVLEDKALFDEFYSVEFNQAQALCGFAPQAAETVRTLKRRGFQVALATNPLFPAQATRSRIRWAGLEPDDFALYTTYEDSTFCKPNPAYFLEVAQRLNTPPEKCLMVGNDAVEDMAAQNAGMSVFLLTDCLVNTQGLDINAFPHGDFSALERFLSQLKDPV